MSFNQNYPPTWNLLNRYQYIIKYTKELVCIGISQTLKVLTR